MYICFHLIDLYLIEWYGKWKEEVDACIALVNYAFLWRLIEELVYQRIYMYMDWSVVSGRWSMLANYTCKETGRLAVNALNILVNAQIVTLLS